MISRRRRRDRDEPEGEPVRKVEKPKVAESEAAQPEPQPATPEQPEPVGAGGLLQDPTYNKADAVMIQRAIRNDWPISDGIRLLVVNKMALIVGTSKDDRAQVAAAKVLVAADGANMKREAMDLSHEQHKEGSTTLHIHAGTVGIEHVRAEVLGNHERLEQLRREPHTIDLHAGPVRADGKPWQMGVRQPPEGSGQGGDGHDRGS